MEVATMTLPAFITSNRTLIRIAIQGLLLSTVLIVGYGCGPEAFTYAKEAHKEGMDLYQEGDYVDASAAFANAVRQNPRDYNSYFYLGASYQAMGSYQQSISAYRSCLDTMTLTLEGKQDNAMKFRAMDSLAMVISKSATNADETTAMEKKCAGQPLVDDQWLLAKIYRYSGDADAAVLAYDKAVLLDGSRFEISKEAGLYEKVLGQNDRAALTLKKAYAVNQTDDQVNDALHQLGVVTGPSLVADQALIHAY
jgi:tetratricopeptide (TPR) repeat protein